MSSYIKINLIVVFIIDYSFFSRETFKRLLKPRYSRYISRKEYAYHFFSAALLAKFNHSYQLPASLSSVIRRHLVHSSILLFDNQFFPSICDSKYGLMYNPVYSELKTFISCTETFITYDSSLVNAINTAFDHMDFSLVELLSRTESNSPLTSEFLLLFLRSHSE